MKENMKTENQETSKTGTIEGTNTWQHEDRKTEIKEDRKTRRQESRKTGLIVKFRQARRNPVEVAHQLWLGGDCLQFSRGQFD
jgi:hypothetical protein